MAPSTDGSAPRKESTQVRAVRAPKITWARVQAKAEREGLKINRVLIELLEGWVRGAYVLPKVKTETTRVYPATATAAPAAPASPQQEAAQVG